MPDQTTTTLSARVDALYATNAGPAIVLGHLLGAAETDPALAAQLDAWLTDAEAYLAGRAA